MAKPFNPDRFTKPGAHATGEPNLYLLIASNGNNARSWSFRYYKHGKTNVLGLGALHVVTYEKAAIEAMKLRVMLHEGKDPKIERAKLAPLAVPSFDECATKFIAAKSAEWTNPKHVKQWQATLATYATPIIGSLPVNIVATEHILRILNPIWLEKTETARRLRQRIEAVLSYAKSLELRDGENPAAWDDHLKNLLAAPGKISKVRNQPALPWQQMPAFIAALRQRQGQAAKAIELAILTATRSGEVRGANWSEFDLEAATWTIPADRMKADVEHHIPLSAPALALLKNLPKHASTDLLFPSTKKTMLSDMTLSALVRGMNEPEVVWVDAKGQSIVVHGFRGTFRTWAAEQTNIPRDVAEHALAHQLPNKVEAAYLHTTQFQKRIRLMDEWAAWVTSRPGAVLPLRHSEAA